MKTIHLLTPGPVPMPPEVYEALSTTMSHHRTPEFETLLCYCFNSLKDVFRTKQPVLIHTSTGSGAMESAIVNTLSSKDEVLVINSGKFGERWRNMCETYRLKKVHELLIPWGKTASAEQVKKYLENNKNIKAVLTQYCETSTGVLHPIKEIAEVVKKFPSTLLLVDAITAIGAVELEMDSWGIDVVCAGSQKAFMMPTGLSFISLSEKAWAANEQSDLPKYYFDLKAEKKANESLQTRFSSPISHIRALKAYFNYFYQNGGLEKSILRCHQLSAATHSAIEILGLKSFTESPCPSLTTLIVPKDIDGKKWRQHMQDKYQVIFMGGQDQLTGKIIRIGHLGYITNKNLLAGIEALGLSLIDLKFNLNPERVKEATNAAQSLLGGV